MARPEYPPRPIEGYPRGLHPVDPSTHLQPALPLKVWVIGTTGEKVQVPLFSPKLPLDQPLMPFPPS